MNRHATPLLVCCASVTLALSALAYANPNGVYSEYINALDGGTPQLAVVLSAARDGVFPWAAPTRPAATIIPAQYQHLTETVTDEEMYSSVGSSAPFEDASETQEKEIAEEAAPAAEIPEETAPEEEEPVEENSPVDNGNGFYDVDPCWFDDALFIGDSHIEGFSDYSGVRGGTYYFKRGLDIWSVMKKAFVGGSQTIPEALAGKQFGKIYIMLGINEIGCGTTESFAEQYGVVVQQLRELQPDALIYIQAIFHTSQKKSDSSVYNNERINARNEAISHLADGEHIFFVDSNPAFDDETGALKKEYTGDGVHVKAPYYTLWRDELLHYGRNIPGVVFATPKEEGAEEEDAKTETAKIDPASIQMTPVKEKPVQPKPVKPVEMNPVQETAEAREEAAPDVEAQEDESAPVEMTLPELTAENEETGQTALEANALTPLMEAETAESAEAAPEITIPVPETVQTAPVTESGLLEAAQAAAAAKAASEQKEEQPVLFPSPAVSEAGADASTEK